MFNKIKQLLKFNYDNYRVKRIGKLDVYFVEIYLHKSWILRKFEVNVNNLNTHLNTKQLRRLKTNGTTQYFTTNSY
jgi:hypothetical protein